MITEFQIRSFTEFMFLLNDFEESLDMWQKSNISNTWDMNISIGEGVYVINIEINEGTDKSK